MMNRPTKVMSLISFIENNTKMSDIGTIGKHVEEIGYQLIPIDDEGNRVYWAIAELSENERLEDLSYMRLLKIANELKYLGFNTDKEEKKWKL